MHPNVAILPWSFVAENVTKPLLGAEGATEQEFTANVHMHTASSADRVRVVTTLSCY